MLAAVPLARFAAECVLLSMVSVGQSPAAANLDGSVGC